MGFKSWNNSMLQKYRGNPALLVTAAIGIGLGLYLLNKTVKPFFSRHKREKAQEFADTLFELENKGRSVDN